MRSWIGWTACGLLAVSMVGVCGSEAEAADVLAATGLVELLPVGRLTGDGQADAVLHAVLRTPAGAPITGAKLKVTAEAGTAEEVTEVGDGVYRFRFVPPKVDAARLVRLTIKGRTDQLGAVEDVADVSVVPAVAGRVDVVAASSVLTLGVDTETPLTITLPASAEPDAKPSDVVVRTTSGEVVEVASVGGNKFVARYRTPGVNYPHVALVTVVDRRDPEKVWGSLVVPLQGKVDYPVTAPAGATVVLRVGSKDFGPATADAAGRASVPILVPPGTETATQIVNVGGRLTESLLDLRVPPTPRVELFDLPDQLPADSRLGVPVRIKAVKASGVPETDVAPVVTATAGRLSEPRHAGDGIWIATFTPPDARSAVTASLQASTKEAGAQGVTLEVGLVPALPASLLVSSEPATLSTGATGLDVYASLRAADGTGLPSRTLRVRAAGAHLVDAVQDLKGGDYKVNLGTDGNTDVFVRVVALTPAAANAVEHVVVLPSREAIAPQGAQVLTVVTTDAWGAPVPNVPVRLTVLEGGGRVPASVTTDESGVAEVVYEGGFDPGVATVEASTGTAAFARSFWQASLTGAKALPVSGTADDRRIAGLYDAAQAVLYVEREGGADAPVAPVQQVAAATPSKLAVVAEPSVAPAGSTVNVDVRVLTEAGDAVAAPVEVFASSGARVGAAEDLGAGHYRVPVTIPVDAVGAVKVNVVAAGGAVVSVVDVPVVGVVAQTTTETRTEVGTAAPIEREFPHLRIRLGALVDGYTYEQTPSEDPGSLLPTTLGWGGERGGGPIAGGFDANVRGFLPMAEYIGLDVGFRWARYAVSNNTFSERAVDNLYWLRADVVGRVPFRVGRDQLHIGAKAGFRYDDLITFRGCLDAGCTVSYEPVRIPGLDVGLELGAEFWKMYLLAQGTAGFAYGSQPFAANADLNVGFQLSKSFFLDLGFGYQGRKAILQSAETEVERGRIKDQQLLGTIGVGFSM